MMETADRAGLRNARLLISFYCLLNKNTAPTNTQEVVLWMLCNAQRERERERERENWKIEATGMNPTPCFSVMCSTFFSVFKVRQTQMRLKFRLN